jgi:hypothetical protein
MTNAPYYEKSTVRFRDAAESEKFNDHIEEVFYDLTELFNMANEQERDIQTIRSFHEVGSHFAQEQMDQMKRELAALKEDLSAVQRPGQEYTKMLFPADAAPDETVDEYERALIDTQHDVITLPFSSFSSSKLYLYDELNHEYIVPNTLQYDVTPHVDNLIIKETDFIHAITPDEFAFWHRQYTYFSGLKDQVEAQITIKLPDNIISNRDVNTIYIHPFPLNTMDIMNVEYQLDGGWRTIPGFKPIEEAGNVRLCFSPLEMSDVRVTLRQRHFITKGNQQIFHMGLRELGVSHNDYQVGVGRFDIPVEFNTAFSNKEIISIKPIYLNEETLSVNQKSTRLLTFKVYEVDDNGNLIYLNDTFPIQIKKRKILLKGVLSFDQNTRSAPTLSGIELTYKGDS